MSRFAIPISVDRKVEAVSEMLQADGVWDWLDLVQGFALTMSDWKSRRKVARAVEGRIMVRKEEVPLENPRKERVTKKPANSPTTSPLLYICKDYQRSADPGHAGHVCGMATTKQRTTIRGCGDLSDAIGGVSSVDPSLYRPIRGR